MFPNNLEFFAYERQQDLLRTAEQIKLIETLRQRQVDERGIFRSVKNWIGVQLVKWGLKLQGHRLILPSQKTVATAANGDCSQA
jgi:hypothetical protein